jgi:ABC-type amino acid transport substrate-binding protein
MRSSMHRLSAIAVFFLGAWVLAEPLWAADDLLKKVKERGTLRACTINYVPWNIKNPLTNAWEGINIEFVEEIAQALGVEIEYIDTTWATVIQSLQTDKCDLGAAALWTSPQRAELVTFTRPTGVMALACSCLPIPRATRSRTSISLAR